MSQAKDQIWNNMPAPAQETLKAYNMEEIINWKRDIKNKYYMS